MAKSKTNQSETRIAESESSDLTGLRFPSTTGRNLAREQISLPQGLPGKANLVLIAFQRWHQQQVDSWISTIKLLRREFPGLEYFELPVLSERNFLGRAFLNEGMRAGIPNHDTRQRTITLYLDKASFRQALGMPDEKDIYILLLDDSGLIQWRTVGWHSDEKIQHLRNYLISHMPNLG